MINTATPAIVWGYLPVAISNIYIFSAAYFEALLTSIPSSSLLQA